jgi:hypothetical protein
MTVVRCKAFDDERISNSLALLLVAQQHPAALMNLARPCGSSLALVDKFPWVRLSNVIIYTAACSKIKIDKISTNT